MKTMNHKHINVLFALVLQATMMVALWGCSEEELTDGIAPGQYELSLTVTDGGYTSGDIPDPQTRAEDNGYRTTFTEGDHIGLYAVDEHGSFVIKNGDLRLTDLKWKPFGNGILTVGNAVRFFVYYPYKASLTTVNPSATTADEFFADMISKFSPNSGQESDYTTNDLMVGMGIPGEPTGNVRPVAIRLAHKMALIVFSPPKTKYTLSTDNQYTWLADDAYLAPDGNNRSFYYMKDGTYRYLVKPDVETKLSCTFMNSNDETRKFELTATIPAGTCKTFTIDGGNTTEKLYTIQTGDYYMNDGSLVSKDKKMNERLQKACIGIVAKVGRAEQDFCDYKFKGTSTQMSSVHGYVLALKNTSYSNIEWCSLDLLSAYLTNDRGGTPFYGYTATKDIIANIEKKGLSLYSDAPATYRATEDFEYYYPSPDNASGWFLPSIDECEWWGDHAADILPSVQNAKGDSWNGLTYWSSSETVDSTVNVYCLTFSSSSTTEKKLCSKLDEYYVRPWLVF